MPKVVLRAGKFFQRRLSVTLYQQRFFSLGNAVAQPVIGADHLKVIRTTNPDNGAKITIIGVERIGESESRRLAGELGEVLRAAQPDTLVLQFCEDRYRKHSKESGSEEIPLNVLNLLDPRHIANSARLGLHLINSIAAGPRFNFYMFLISQAKQRDIRIVLGDIPFSVLQYKNEVGRSYKEAKAYMSAVDRKRRKRAHYPGLIQLLTGLGSLDNFHDWVKQNRKGIMTKEKILTEFATELHQKKGINRSYFDETCLSMAHSTYNARGQNILVVCNHLAMERIYQNLGKTSREQIKKLRKLPAKPLQNARLLSSWLLNWWNLFCGFMYLANYYAMGYHDPLTLAVFLGMFPTAYPLGWSIISLRARRRVRKFQQIIMKRRSQPMFESA